MLYGPRRAGEPGRPVSQRLTAQQAAEPLGLSKLERSLTRRGRMGLLDDPSRVRTRLNSNIVNGRIAA